MDFWRSGDSTLNVDSALARSNLGSTISCYLRVVNEFTGINAVGLFFIKAQWSCCESQER